MHTLQERNNNIEVNNKVHNVKNANGKEQQILFNGRKDKDLGYRVVLWRFENWLEWIIEPYILSYFCSSTFFADHLIKILMMSNIDCWLIFKNCIVNLITIRLISLVVE